MQIPSSFSALRLRITEQRRIPAHKQLDSRFFFKPQSVKQNIKLKFHCACCKRANNQDGDKKMEPNVAMSHRMKRNEGHL